MSLYIEVDNVQAVLLADGWHTVKGRSFDLDSFEFYADGQLIASDGCGATWIEANGARICCPFKAIRAVRRMASPVRQNASQSDPAPLGDR